MDGTYINSSRMVLNGSGQVANVPLLMGTMRDEPASLFLYQNTTNVTQALKDTGFNASYYNSTLFPIPSSSNKTLDVFNATTHLETDGIARCFNQAIAYTSSKNDVFKSVWYYEYDRSYQDPTFDLNRPLCDAPVDAQHPYGDPKKPYFR
jgi:hypothetical protein